MKLSPPKAFGKEQLVHSGKRFVVPCLTVLTVGAAAPSAGAADATPRSAGPYSVMKTCGAKWVGGFATGIFTVTVNAAGHVEQAYFYPNADRLDSQSTQHAGTVTVRSTGTITAWDGHCSNI